MLKKEQKKRQKKKATPPPLSTTEIKPVLVILIPEILISEDTWLLALDSVL